jgi:hypothetical protein
MCSLSRLFILQMCAITLNKYSSHSEPRRCRGEHRKISPSQFDTKQSRGEKTAIDDATQRLGVATSLLPSSTLPHRPSHSNGVHDSVTSGDSVSSRIAATIAAGAGQAKLY